MTCVQNADNIKQVGHTYACTIEDKLTHNEKDIIGINNIARILHSKLINFDGCIVGSRTFKNVPPSGLIVPPSDVVFLKLLLRYQYELCTACHLYGIHTLEYIESIANSSNMNCYAKQIFDGICWVP